MGHELLSFFFFKFYIDPHYYREPKTDLQFTYLVAHSFY